MGSFERIAARLPALYAPEKRGDDALSFFLGAASDLLDVTSEEISAIMQTHWFRYADSALYHPWFRLVHARTAQPLPKPGDTDVLLFPHIYDLGRLAGLFNIMPWQEGSAYSESVEAFRRRTARLVALWRNGLGTLGAIRSMVEASLPFHAESGLPLVDLSFHVEENPLVDPQCCIASVKGLPEGIVGPLMRWRLTNNGTRPVLPTVYLQGIAVQELVTDATVNPCIERMSGAGVSHHAALAYSGILAPGVTLRVRPAFASLCGTVGGIMKAVSEPAGEKVAVPAPPNDWTTMPGELSGQVVALCQTKDKSVWAAVNADDDDAKKKSSLWRFGGSDWIKVLDGIDFIYDMHESCDDLLLATVNGCVAVDPYALEESARVRGTVFGRGKAVYTIADIKGTRWYGTAEGVWPQQTGGAMQTPILSFEKILTISSDSRGTVYLGTDHGLFQYHPSSMKCWIYQGGDHSDAVRDWVAIDPLATTLPEIASGYLPEVTAVLRARDKGLWVGTVAGIARYGATARENNVYTTHLAAFPALCTGEVFDIQEDERGCVWFCTEQGLMVHDGRDFFQVTSGTLKRLVGAGEAVEEMLSGTGLWRYDRVKEEWQEYRERDAGWRAFSGDALVANGQPVFSLLWIDTLAADLGSFDGTTFIAQSAEAATSFSVRFKVNDRRIVTGGVPALPRIPRGVSTWRYLRRESGDEKVSSSGERWSSEGRQLFGKNDVVELPPARFNDRNIPRAVLGRMVYGFLPSARLWLSWNEPAPCTVLVRLAPLDEDGKIDSIVVDRVWQALEGVRPAGVKILLAVNETIVRGKVI